MHYLSETSWHPSEVSSMISDTLWLRNLEIFSSFPKVTELVSGEAGNTSRLIFTSFVFLRSDEETEIEKAPV